MYKNFLIFSLYISLIYTACVSPSVPCSSECLTKGFQNAASGCDCQRLRNTYDSAADTCTKLDVNWAKCTTTDPCPAECINSGYVQISETSNKKCLGSSDKLCTQASVSCDIKNIQYNQSCIDLQYKANDKGACTLANIENCTASTTGCSNFCLSNGYTTNGNQCQCVLPKEQDGIGCEVRTASKETCPRNDRACFQSCIDAGYVTKDGKCVYPDKSVCEQAGACDSSKTSVYKQVCLFAGYSMSNDDATKGNCVRGQKDPCQNDASPSSCTTDCLLNGFMNNDKNACVCSSKNIVSNSCLSNPPSSSDDNLGNKFGQIYNFLVFQSILLLFCLF